MRASPRHVLLYTWAATIGFAVLYLGWVGISRYLANRPVTPPKPVANPATDFGTSLKILQFYANTFEITEGERAILCYGVANARSVRLQPPVEEIRPSVNRCFWVQPERTTTYKLLAEGPLGETASETFTIKVKSAPASILFVDLSSGEIRRGEPLVLCYGTRRATSVRLEPTNMVLPPSEKYCVRLYPVRTTAYTLVVAGADGRTDREKFTIKVN
jgi:hypothetical protein